MLYDKHADVVYVQISHYRKRGKGQLRAERTGSKAFTLKGAKLRQVVKIVKEALERGDQSRAA